MKINVQDTEWLDAKKGKGEEWKLPGPFNASLLYGYRLLTLNQFVVDLQ